MKNYALSIILAICAGSAWAQHQAYTPVASISSDPIQMSTDAQTANKRADSSATLLNSNPTGPNDSATQDQSVPNHVFILGLGMAVFFIVGKRR
ncbi:hypothetical protein MCEMSE15_01794 [Fimbriimonadaceae bacterium]